MTATVETITSGDSTILVVTSGNNSSAVIDSSSQLISISNAIANISNSLAFSDISSAIASIPAPPDYSSQFDVWGNYWLRLVVAAEKIANNTLVTANASLLIANNTLDIANNTLRTAEATENIESHQLNMRNDLHHLRILGDHNGSGIRMTSPYNWLLNAYYYKWFITQGHIIEPEFDAPIADMSAAIASMEELMKGLTSNFSGVYSNGAEPDEQPLQSPPN